MRSNKEYIARMKEVMRPIDKQIMMCDDHNELMMLAAAMLSASKRILNTQLGVDETSEIFRMVLNDEHSKRIPFHREVPPEDSF